MKDETTDESRRFDYAAAEEARRNRDRDRMGVRYASQKLDDAASALEVLMYLVYLTKQNADDQASVMEYMTLAEDRLVLVHEIARDIAHLNNTPERNEGGA